MSIYNRNSGFGITGTKNIFNTNVKLGNWVEDRIGVRLIEHPRPGYTSYETNFANDYKNPTEQVRSVGVMAKKFEGSVKYLSKSELKAKNKEGLSYALLFQHGLTGEDISPEVIIFVLYCKQSI